MPTHKDFKRLVRTRMRKTGESYTAARAQIVRSRPAVPPSRSVSSAKPRFPEGPRPAEFAKIAGMSDAAVRTATGCDWKKWVEALDYAGAFEWPHARIAKHLNTAHGVPGWWAQTVTVGYERIRGLRETGQRRGGAFEAAKSRTYGVPMARLYAAFATPAARRRWLPGIALTVRTATRHRSMRMTWPDGTSVQAWFVAKSDAKSAVQIQHGKLPDRDAMARTKAWWGERLDALGDLLAARGAGARKKK